MTRVAGRFARVEPRRTARAFVTGLLAPLERKTCWALAEQAGHHGPQAMQRLLRTARWDADAVRDDLRGYVVDHLGHPNGVLICDETGFLKKGACSVGVQRQYSGTAGRIENSQVAVFCAYASPRGRALIDRRLYLPEASWCADRARRAAAGVPDAVRFATKPRLALDMITAALDAGVPASWVAADEVYGADPGLRHGLERRGIGYVLAVGCGRRVHVNRGVTAVRADEAVARLSDRAWQRHSAGPGAKGPRHYLWAWIDTAVTAGEHRWLLVRRHPSTGELAFYRCWSPTAVPLRALVHVAGVRWAVEELFQAGKGQTGLDHYQTRGWTAWYRFVTLAMLALALLAVLAATQPALPDTDRVRLIPLTVAEIRRLFTTLVAGARHSPAHRLRWSSWRRKVQARARQSHYRRRLALDG